MGCISHLRFLFLATFRLLHRFVVLHLAFEVSEVLSDLLIGQDCLLIGGFLDFLGEDHVCFLTLSEPGLNLLDNVKFLSLHVLHAIRQSSGLPLIVVHVLIQVVLAASLVLVEFLFFTLNSLLLKLELPFLFTHLMSKLLEHGDLLASLVIHDCCLLAEL